MSSTNKIRAIPKLFDGVSKGVLGGQIDRFNGIKINHEEIEPSSTPEDFKKKIVSTVEEYKR